MGKVQIRRYGTSRGCYGDIFWWLDNESVTSRNRICEVLVRRVYTVPTRPMKERSGLVRPPDGLLPLPLWDVSPKKYIISN